MVEILIDIVFALIGVVLGGYILFAGRRKVWLTAGIVALMVAARLLALLVADVESGWALIDAQAWWLIAAAFGVGGIGMLLGRYLPELAVQLIAFAAGANVALWLNDIVVYTVDQVASTEGSIETFVILALILLGGLAGLWLIRRSRDEVMILITMVIGVDLIQDALGFNRSSSLTAIVIISLALAGVMVQFADYLRDSKAETGVDALEPAASSIAYFQDLELDD